MSNLIQKLTVVTDVPKEVHQGAYWKISKSPIDREKITLVAIKEVQKFGILLQLIQVKPYLTGI